MKNRGRKEGAEGTGHRKSKKRERLRKAGGVWGLSHCVPAHSWMQVSLIIVSLAHLRQGSDWSTHCFIGSPVSGLWLVDTLFQWLTCVRALIGRHIVSLATRINPMATSWVDMGVWVGPSCSWRKALTCGGWERGRGENGVAYLCLSDVMVRQAIHVEYEQGGTSLVSVSNISMVTRLLRGSFSLGPKILGKYLQQSWRFKGIHTPPTISGGKYFLL